MKKYNNLNIGLKSLQFIEKYELVKANNPLILGKKELFQYEPAKIEQYLNNFTWQQKDFNFLNIKLQNEKKILLVNYWHLEAELNEFLSIRKNIIETKILTCTIKENLNHSTAENIEKNLIWLTWEFIFKEFIWGILNEHITWDYDVDYNKIKIDVKTVKTNKDLTPDNLKNYSFYLQSKQLKEDVLYCPLILNTRTKQAVIFYNGKMIGKNIKEKLKPVFKNPPFAKENPLLENYIIPYNKIT